jgi:hypothetical protein
MKPTYAVRGWLGGRARAKALTPERRREIARLANKARWARLDAKARRKATEPARVARAKVKRKKAAK